MGMALAGTVVTALLVAGAVLWLGLDLLDVHGLKHEQQIGSKVLFDLVKLSFAVVAGLGGLVALVVTYRKQRTEENAALRENTKLHNDRFTAAAAQLDASPAVRLCGVHALAGLADDAPTRQLRQTCIDVLCAYLRLPYDPDPGDAPEHAQAHQTYRALREVRHTIIRLIAAHLRDGALVSWQGHDLDFTDVAFDNADFTEARFSGGVVAFTNAKFSGGTVTFRDAVFSEGTVDFRGAGFSGGVVAFTNAKFSGGTVTFRDAVFSEGTVDFRGAGFSGGVVAFTNAKFSGGTVTFHAAVFSGSTVDFRGAGFSGGAVDLHFAGFSDGTVTFRDAVFSGSTVTFHDAAFSGGTVTFPFVRFSGGVVAFTNAKFSGGTVDFLAAAFSGGVVDFRDAGFSDGLVAFTNAKFSGGTVDLRDAAFSGGVVDFSSPMMWRVPPAFSADRIAAEGLLLPPEAGAPS